MIANGYPAAVNGPTSGLRSKASAVNSVPSLRFVPSMIGTWLNWPEIRAVAGCWGMMSPSTLGKKAASEARLTALVMLVCSVRIEVTDRLRRQATVAVLVESLQPSAATIAAPCCSAPLRVGSGEAHGPLSVMACRNSPVALGEKILEQTLMPPADSPKIVTLLGSPPKAEIF